VTRRGRTGIARASVFAIIALALLLPTAGAQGPTGDSKVLDVGVLQSLDSLDPYLTELSLGDEAYELSYQEMVGFGADLEPVPDFAVSWQRAADGHSWTFKFRPDMQWSDGEPATSADACFSWQLALDAIDADSYLGVGYLDPGLKNAGVTKVECPDPTTMVATTDDASARILQTSLPILPKHIWSQYTYAAIANPKLFELPADGHGLVGSGPYQAVEWNKGDFVRFRRNPHYALHQGVEDEIVFRSFRSSDAMVQALTSGQIDYARGITPDQMRSLANEPDIRTVHGAKNGWTELGFNTYGSGTGKTIEGGGPSTRALQDPAFRDALGYAIDKQKLIDDVLGGYGTVGTTQIPPVLKAWHVDPTSPRTFDIETANRKLDAAGYPKGKNGVRVDKEGKPIVLRLVMPDSDPNFAKDARLITEWFGEVGIKVTSKRYNEDALIDVMLPPEAGDPARYKADYDLFIWTWSWGPDPSGPLQIFTCDQIGSSSDSFWCDKDYDALFQQQLVAPDDAARLEIVAQMQQLWYDNAPYHILYYDDNLHAYRTDTFAGWENQPSNGTPLFSYSVRGETLLTSATAVVSPSGGATASAAPAPSSMAPSPSPTPTDISSSTGSTPILLVVLAVVLALGAGLVRSRRRDRPTEDGTPLGERRLAAAVERPVDRPSADGTDDRRDDVDPQ
jgi:peptide/nickel transport system substrate-binding protein